MTPAEKITNALGGTWHGNYGTARCPCHDDLHASLSIRDGDDAPLVTDHSGRCGRRAIVDELRRRGCWTGEGATRRPMLHDQNADGPRAIFRKAVPIAGTLGETYLRSRGITLPLPPSLKYSGALLYSPSKIYLPAMVAAVQGPDRRIVAIQRTYLTEKGRKAPVASPKMSLGALGTGAVRLAPAADLLGIAEGIETALSAMQITGIPTWVSLGGERLGKIELPPEVRRVVIFGNRGSEAQAEKAARAYWAAGRPAEICYPDDAACKDFNDMLMRARLAKVQP